ncbi:MAG: hypothetical protein IJH63_00435 [Methanobrevibacter sp.]|nr:hypothetical protein [Methanosphaera sp.]MBR0369170.1 hypothetical protein [Methanobrevibacter sp.]
MVRKSEDNSFCDGCCNRRTCNHDLEKCCYLVRNECMLQEGYVVRTK